MSAEWIEYPVGRLIVGFIPWFVLALVMLWRARGTPFLTRFSAFPGTADPPLLSIVIPARNEAHNIERCVRSVLRSNYPRLEVIVVDDHSTDGTASIAAATAASDARLRITVPPPLPDDWFGKSWACAHGAEISRGEYILFTDADTWHHPELHTRLINAARELEADLLSVGGAQEARTFWEKLIQPLVFLLILLRYGGPGVVNRSRNPRDKIANGQCILTSREAYLHTGGHSSVRGTVAEDLKLAQVYAMRARRPMLIAGLEFLSTRMYRSLSELIQGWGKNIYAGSLETVPANWFAQRIGVPIALLLPPLLATLIPLASLLCLAADMSAACYWLVAASIALLVLCASTFVALRVNPLYAILYPLGSAVLLYIVAGAIARGRRVSWKGRDYTSR